MKSPAAAFGRMRNIVTVLVIISAMGLFTPVAAQADDPVTFGMPSQDSCDNGSTTYTWDELGIDRPVIASMTVDGETVVDPTTPVDGSIGAVVCPTVDLARKTAISVFRRDGDAGIDYFADLDGATTPSGDPITEDSDITITLTNMGELAEFYSYSLVHGVVSNWETEGLGTQDAQLSVTLSPARTPMGSGDEQPYDFSFCTATPPNCQAEQSMQDSLSASLDMDFNQENTDGTFRGAYFGLVGAMGGFVTAEGAPPDRHLVAALGAPHFLADGSTPNTGSMQAFLPTDVVADLFQVETSTVADLTDESFTVQRSENDVVDPSDVPFSVDVVSGGIVITVDEITFSSPEYSIGLVGASGGDDDEQETGETNVDFPVNGEEAQGLAGVVAVGSDDEDATVDAVSVAAMSTEHPDSGFTFPLGLLSFTMTVPEGSTQHITTIWETSTTASHFVLRKYNSTAHTYSAISNAVITDGLIQGQHVIVAKYDITDNGILDQSSTLGTIVDPVGLAVATNSNTTANGTLADTGSHELALQLQVVAMLLSFGGVMLFMSRRRLATMLQE